MAKNKDISKTICFDFILFASMRYILFITISIELVLSNPLFADSSILSGFDIARIPSNSYLIWILEELSIYKPRTIQQNKLQTYFNIFAIVRITFM